VSIDIERRRWYWYLKSVQRRSLLYTLSTYEQDLATTTTSTTKDTVSSSASYSSLKAHRIQKHLYKEKAYLASKADFHHPSDVNPFPNPILSKTDSKLAPPVTLDSVQHDISMKAKKAVEHANAKISNATFAKKQTI
jgi:hypothetical protein